MSMCRGSSPFQLLLPVHVVTVSHSTWDACVCVCVCVCACSRATEQWTLLEKKLHPFLRMCPHLRASAIRLCIVGDFTVLHTEPFSEDTLNCGCVIDV